MRINKLFSNFGICSRKCVNKLIENKRIKINGELCVLGQWVNDDDEILFDEKPIFMMDKVYIAFNKPVGITTTAEKSVKENIIDFINYPQYIFPVGRLDKESEGLIILTNDGDLANTILDAENNHDKEYIVRLNRSFDDDFIAKMSKGVKISGIKSSGIKRISDTVGVRTNKGYEEVISLNSMNLGTKKINLSQNNNNFVTTRSCKVRRISNDTFRIILTQGLNKQIRKMCGALGYKVIQLKRVRIMNINLDNIESGNYRVLSKQEINELTKLAKII